MSLQSIDARISKIEQRVVSPTVGKTHIIYEADPGVGARKVAELEGVVSENDMVILVTSLRPRAAIDIRKNAISIGV
jgi:hypothetical protein